MAATVNHGGQFEKTVTSARLLMRIRHVVRIFGNQRDPVVGLNRDGVAVAHSFPTEVKAFGPEFLKSSHAPGDYDFFRHATGTDFDAYLVLGSHVFLICNNTAQSMTGITEDPLWLKAQVPFVEMSEQFRAAPVVET